MHLPRRPRTCTDTALIVALFLVVQAFVSGLSIGARAETLPAGTILCLGSGGVASADDPARAGLHLIDCCTLGCPMLGGALPQPASAALPATIVKAAETAVFAAEHLSGRSELAPLHSRAPPYA